MIFSRVPRTVALVGAGLALLATTGSARADEPVALEADSNPSTFPPPSTRPNLILVGAALTAGWYGAALGASYGWRDSNGSSSLRIPVAGPYMALGKTGCSSGSTECDVAPSILRTVLTVVSAVGQTGGILAMLEGVFVPTSAAAGPSAMRETETRASASSAATHVAVVPTSFASGGLGVGVFGDF